MTCMFLRQLFSSCRRDWGLDPVPAEVIGLALSTFVPRAVALLMLMGSRKEGGSMEVGFEVRAKLLSWMASCTSYANAFSESMFLRLILPFSKLFWAGRRGPEPNSALVLVCRLLELRLRLRWLAYESMKSWCCRKDALFLFNI